MCTTCSPCSWPFTVFTHPGPIVQHTHVHIPLFLEAAHNKDSVSGNKYCKNWPCGTWGIHNNFRTSVSGDHIMHRLVARGMVGKKAWALKTQDTWQTKVRLLNLYAGCSKEQKVGCSLFCHKSIHKLTWHTHRIASEEAAAEPGGQCAGCFGKCTAM